MRKGFVALVGLVGFMGFMGLMGSCSEVSREEMASLAAKGYYEHLIRGEYEAFLAGRCDADSLPENYRNQLIDGYKQFMANQASDHQGVREVKVMRAVADSVKPQTNLEKGGNLSGKVDVFLIVCFGDSINEEIVVPMVEQGEGKWRMK